jgi:hypothetical protein
MPGDKDSVVRRLREKADTSQTSGRDIDVEAVG